MNRLISPVIALVTLAICCSSGQQSTPKADFARIFPKELSGFERTTDIRILTVKSLSDNPGEPARSYLDYGVIAIATAEYQINSTIYSIDIFHFNDLLGAFGVYASKRLPDDTYISVGTESVLRPGQLYYFKDKFFMIINSTRNDMPDLESLRHFASALDSLMPGTEMFPREFDIFPEKRLIAHSQRYWPNGFDEYTAPESCFSTDYLRRGQTCRLFYAAGKTVDEYDSFVGLIQQNGRILTHMAGIGKNSIYAITGDDKKILAGFADGIIYGVLDVANDYWAKALCEALFENMGKKL